MHFSRRVRGTISNPARNRPTRPTPPSSATQHLPCNWSVAHDERERACVGTRISIEDERAEHRLTTSNHPLTGPLWLFWPSYGLPSLIHMSHACFSAFQSTRPTTPTPPTIRILRTTGRLTCGYSSTGCTSHSFTMFFKAVLRASTALAPYSQLLVPLLGR